MQVIFGVGQILSVDPKSTNAQGQVVPVVFVKSFVDGTVLPVEWVPIGAEQNMPMVGQIALYYRVGTYHSRIVAVHGLNPTHIRKGEFALNEGEACLQSDSGLGYVLCTQDGSVITVTGDMTNSWVADSSGLTGKATNIRLGTYAGFSLQLLEDGTFALTKTVEDEVKAAVKIDTNGNIVLETVADFSVKATNILLDGKIFLGPGATDPDTRRRFGQAITAGPWGTYPFDFLSGAPIPASGSVNIMA